MSSSNQTNGDNNDDNEDGEQVMTNIPDRFTDDDEDHLRMPPSLSNHEDKPFQSVLPTLILSILLGLVSGTAYGFGRYARTLKEILGVSQSQVQSLGIFMDCGNYVGHPLVGYIYDKKGPVVSCVLGAILAFVCYWRIRWTLLNYDVSEHEDMLSESGILLLEMAFFGVGFSSGLGYMSGLGTTTKELMKLSSPKYFGTCIGMVAAGCGLSSTLVGISYKRSPDLPSFFLFWALIVPVVNLCAAVFFQLQRNQEAGQTYELVEQANGDSGPLLCCSPTLELVEAQEPSASNKDEVPVLSDDESIVNDAWDSWRKAEFWLLFAAFSCASGCGLMVINNLSTMAQSIGGSDALSGTLIIVLSFSNVAGRVFMGAIGDAVTTKSSSLVLPRIRLLQAVNLTMALAMLLAFVGGQQQFFLVVFVVVVASAYGSAWVLIVALTPNLFSKKHFGKDYGLLALGPALSGMVFNKASAKWYEQHINEHNICVGRECYGKSYLAAGSMAALGIVITGMLYRKQSREEQEERDQHLR